MSYLLVFASYTLPFRLRLWMHLKPCWQTIVFIQYLFMFVFRWRWCGNSRGGCGACRARYQWIMHWYVWKDGHLPARGADRCLNVFLILKYLYRKTHIQLASKNILLCAYTSPSVMHIHPTSSRVQEHAKITDCWRIWTSLQVSSTWKWRTSALTSAETFRISTTNVSEIRYLNNTYYYFY